MTNTLSLRSPVELSIEAAYEAADRLADRDVFYGEAASVISGVHPEWGPVMLIIPPLNSAIVMPAVRILGDITTLPDTAQLKAVAIPSLSL